MSHRFADLMFTPSVREAQRADGSLERMARFAEVAGPNDVFSERERTFIEARDSFYMASVNQDGWPYVQHRGGPPGFLRVVDSRTLAYADFRGNRQMVSVGNVAADDRVSLILVDYPNRRRLKILGHMKVRAVDDAPEGLREVVSLADYRARIERVITISLAAFDWNCPQHITPRYTREEFAAATDG